MYLEKSSAKYRPFCSDLKLPTHLPLGLDGRGPADENFERAFLNEKIRILAEFFLTSSYIV